MDPATTNWVAFDRAYRGRHEEYVRLAKRCSDTYVGFQWDEAVRKELERRGRPALTFNESLQVINAIRGHYSTMRADIAYKPRRRGATAQLAGTLTRLVDQILDSNFYHTNIEPQMFEDGLIEDRGYMDVRVDFAENVLGEVKISVLDPRSVIPDVEASEYDPSSWSEVFADRWMALDQIEETYGKSKRNEAEAVVSHPRATFGSNSVHYDTYGGDLPFYLPPSMADEKRIRSIRVINRQYRRMARVTEFVDPNTGEARMVPEHWERERVHWVLQTYGLVIRERMKRRVRWTVSADHVTLHDEWSPYEEFTIVPYFPMFRRGNPSGIMRHLLDPQEYLNKLESQGLHVINTTANSGWKAEEGSLANMTEDELEQRGGETGLVLIYRRGHQSPEKIEPNRVPTGLENYAIKSRNYVQSIAGASALLGQTPSSEISGVALDRSQGRALTGLQVIFDNLDRTRAILADRILSCVQRYYTEERIFYVTDWRDPRAEQEELVINQQAAGQVVNNIAIGEYEVKASSAPARDTFEETQFAQAIQLREAGIAIPDHYIILASHLAGKEKIAEEVMQMQGLGEPTEAQQQVAQLQLRQLAAEVAEAEAKATNLEADAQLKAAKAQTAVAGEQREMLETVERLKLEAGRLRASVAQKAADLVNKLELAQIHTGAKTGLTRYQQLMNATKADKDRAAEDQRAQLKAQTQLAQAAMSVAEGKEPETQGERRR